MKKSILVLLFLLLFIPSYAYAEINSTVTVGKLEKSNLQLVFDEAIINAYKLYDTNYILVSDLKKLGCSVNYSPADRSITISAPTYGQATPTFDDILLSQPVYLYAGRVTLENFETQALSCNNKTLIPLSSLNTIGPITVIDNMCYFSPNDPVPVAATQTTISNLSEYDLDVSVLDIYWTNEPVLITSTYTLTPFDYQERPLAVTDEKAFYIASIVQSANGEEYTYSANSQMGQINSQLMTQYIRYANRTFRDDYGDSIDREKVIQVEDFINTQNLSSPTKYLVWTNISEQRTYIFEGTMNNWSLLKAFICSTGRDYTPTPKGKFALTYKVPSFGQNKGYCCKYAFGFIGTTYLYHSIIFDKTGSYLLENKGVLGKKASEGCIRFSLDNAKWFYEHLESKTTVFIN